jgi:diguanylate cyclase (GGDEF)-like protein/PAS domain S-box-containing protein
VTLDESDTGRIFQAALDAVPAPVVSISRDYRFVAFNQAFAEQMKALYGIHVQVGQRLVDCVGVSSDLTGMLTAAHRALMGETYVDSVWRGEGESRRHFTTTYTPLLEDGRVVGMTAFAIESTDAERAREQLMLGRQAILNAVPEPAIALDRDCNYIAFNDAWANVVRQAYGTAPVLGESYFDSITDPEDCEEAHRYFARVLKGETLRTATWRGRPGHRRHWTATRSPLVADGKIIGIVSIALDTTDTAVSDEQSKERAQLAAERANLLDRVVEAARDAIAVTDTDGVITEFNQEAEHLTGFGASEATGLNMSFLWSDLQRMAESLALAAGGQDVEIVRTEQRTKNGGSTDVSVRATPIPDLSGATIGVTWSWRPLDLAAMFDPLTNLVNRRGFVEFGKHEIARAERARQWIGLLYADVDNLKAINDEFGHGAGDIALRDVAGMLRSSFREADVVARIGGDEFVVLTTDTAPDGLERMRGRFVEALSAHDTGREPPHALSVSCGVAVSEPGAPCDLDELLGRADALMYADKQAHRARGTQ